MLYYNKCYKDNTGFNIIQHLTINLHNVNINVALSTVGLRNSEHCAFHYLQYCSELLPAGHLGDPWRGSYCVLM